MAASRSVRFASIAAALTAGALLVAAYAGDPAGAERGRVAAADLQAAAPADVGLSADRLDQLAAGLQAMVDDGKLAGAVTLLARHGKIAFADTAGVQDIATGRPLQRDTIFRIYSMTKPITGVALMMLHEEGKWRLEDPVSRYIPGFADLDVHVGGREDGSPQLEAADRSMTMAKLLSHSGGLAYGISNATYVDRLYREQRVLNADAPLQAMIDKLSALPLLAQPGARWHYSISVDVQGYLVEQLSGQPFPEFLQERIFDPLGMVDTAFYVRPDNSGPRCEHLPRERCRQAGGNRHGRPTRTSMPAGPSGGGGLWGTADDYLRFTQMLLNGGELDGARLLAPKTVELMRANHLSPQALATMRPGQGFGLDFAVVLDPAQAREPLRQKHSSYHHGGAAGTWFWIDPLTDLTFVGMIQHLGPGVREVQTLSRRFAYEAVVTP